MSYFGYLFPFLFAGLFCLVIFVLSKMGWADLAAKYQTQKPFTGHHAGLISASINGTNYRNAIILRYNEEGMYLRPVFLFRMFHPPLLIPWTEIKEVRQKKILFQQLRELIIGSPFVAVVLLQRSTFSQLENNLSSQTILKYK